MQRLLDEVRRLSDSQGLAAILVEQNANVALRIADRVAALRTGTIIREAPGRPGHAGAALGPVLSGGPVNEFGGRKAALFVL